MGTSDVTFVTDERIKETGELLFSFKERLNKNKLNTNFSEIEVILAKNFKNQIGFQK